MKSALHADCDLALVSLMAWAARRLAGGPKGKVVIWFDSRRGRNGFIAGFQQGPAAKYPDIHGRVGHPGPRPAFAKLVTAFAGQAGSGYRHGLPVPAGVARTAVQAWAIFQASWPRTPR